MATQEARIVTAKVDDKGVVQEVKDDTFPYAWEPDTSIDRAVQEEHYGWILQDQLKAGVKVNPVFPGSVDICTNNPDDATHMNTIAAMRPELVKLDCGYWGSYDRERGYDKSSSDDKPQRNFGMVQGRDVWLCNFRRDAISDNKDLPADGTAAKQLMDTVKGYGFDIELMMHTVAGCTPFTEDMDPDQLYIFFPDLHLPERLPDKPDDANRPDKAGSSKREDLRHELRMSQHEFGLLAGNRHMDSSRADLIQKYLEDISTGGQNSFSGQDGGTFAASKVANEKKILERTIRSRACWYYPPDSKNDETTDHSKKDDFAVMVADPAADLVCLLSAVMKIKTAGAKVNVVQLGDLYELWMGREFLYRDFPVTAQFSTFSFPRLTLALLQSDLFGEGDEYQYRMDHLWTDGDSTNAHPIKRYPFHQWEKSDMMKRHKTGWSYYQDGQFDDDARKKEVSDDLITRICDLMSERALAVESCSLPMPPNMNDKLTTALADTGLSLNDYLQQTAEADGISPLPDKDYLWHKLIFDLFQKLDFQNIHGNHDGYRSDPLLKGSVGIPAQEWLSFPGIFVEHGHRWDEFNRDGCAIGAGMTNMVYYYNISMTHDDKHSKVKGMIMPQDQKCFIPGVAQWYLLVNMSGHEYKGRDATTVLPFGIVVTGHTHHPDLCRIHFEKEGGFFANLAQDVMTVVKTAEDIAKAGAELLGDAGKKVEQVVGNAGSALQGAASKAADTVGSKIKSLF